MRTGQVHIGRLRPRGARRDAPQDTRHGAQLRRATKDTKASHRRYSGHLHRRQGRRGQRRHRVDLKQRARLHNNATVTRGLQRPGHRRTDRRTNRQRRPRGTHTQQFKLLDPLQTTARRYTNDTRGRPHGRYRHRMVKNRRTIHFTSRMRHIHTFSRQHRPQDRHKANRYRHRHFRNCINRRGLSHRGHTYGQHIVRTHGTDHDHSYRRRANIFHVGIHPAHRPLTRRHTRLTQHRFSASQRTHASGRGLRRRVRSNLPGQRGVTVCHLFGKQRFHTTHARRPPGRNHSNHAHNRKGRSAGREGIRQTKFLQVLGVTRYGVLSTMRRRHRRANNHAGNRSRGRRHHGRH